MGGIGPGWYTALSLPGREETFYPFRVTSLLHGKRRKGGLVSDSIEKSALYNLIQSTSLKNFPDIRMFHTR